MYTRESSNNIMGDEHQWEVDVLQTWAVILTNNV